MCLAIQWALQVSRKRIVYHEHDSLDDNNDCKTRLIVRARNYVAKRAEICVLPNTKRANYFHVQTKCLDPPLVVWNCPSKQELDFQEKNRTRDRKHSQEHLRVVYCGSLNETRVPFTYIHSLVLEPRIELTLIGYETNGSRGFSEQFQKIARELYVDGRVKIRGQIPRHEVFQSLRDADVAIATLPLGSADMNFIGMLGASNKSFDGLSCGIPMLISDLSDWVETFVGHGVAKACDPSDASSIASALGWFADNPQETKEMGRKGRSMIDECWNYEYQFASVLKRMESVCR